MFIKRAFRNQKRFQWNSVIPQIYLQISTVDRYMPEPFSKKSLESQILTNMDLLTRTPINQESCKNLISLIKKTDISYLQLFISVADRYFDTAFNFWGKYQYKIGSLISQIMNLLYSKITYCKAQCLKTAFERLNSKYQRFTKKRVVLLSESQVQMHDSDEKFKQFVSQLDKKKTEQDQDAKVLVRQQVDKPVDIIININKDLGANYLQTRIHYLKQFYYKSKLHCLKSSQRQQEDKLVEQLQERSVYLRDCFNCLSFVYDKEDLAFPLCKQPVTFFGKISQINNMKKEILQQVVSYLNGKGGIILISTQKDQHSITPYYQSIAQYNKEIYESKLQSYFATITPAITLNKQVQLCFIPIAQNVRSSPESLKPIWEKEGAYILRITVTPTDPHIAYYYTSEVTNPADKNDNGTIVFSRNTEVGDEQLRNEAVYEFMKERYQEYNPADRPADSVLRNRGNYHPCLIRHIGPCRTAEKGHLYFGKIGYYQQEKVKDQKVVNPLLVGYQNFKNISLLVVIGSLRQQISRIFLEQQKLQNKIVVAFQKQEFKLSNNTFLIFHNCKFQKLKTGIIKNKASLKLQNDKKQVLLISTLPIIAYEVNKFPQSLQKEVEERVMKITNEKLLFQTIIENGIYIKCPSTITAVYIYYYVHHYHSMKGYFEKLPQGSQSKSKINKNSLKTSKIPSGKGQKNKQTIQEPYYDQVEEEEEYQRGDYHDFEERRTDNYSKNKGNGGVGSKYKEKSNNHSNYNITNPQENYEAENQQQYQYADNQSQAVAPVQASPVLLRTLTDQFGNIHYYYNNSVAYYYNINGQYLGCQYYDMSQLGL